jgi:hypothetical protein
MVMKSLEKTYRLTTHDLWFLAASFSDLLR